MTESDKTDGIHDCIQLHWARLYTRPYKLWSNSNAHHDYFERLQLVFVVECSSVRLNFGQFIEKDQGYCFPVKIEWLPFCLLVMPLMYCLWLYLNCYENVLID